MKKILFLAIVALFSLSTAFAQCTPDANYTQPGIYPVEDTEADTLKVGDAYQKTLTVISVKDTVLFTIPVTIDSTVLINIEGLPSFMNYYCHNQDCFIGAGETGCILFEGTPELADFGVHTVTLYLEVYGKMLGDIDSNPAKMPLEHAFKLYVADTNGMVPIDTLDDGKKEDSLSSVASYHAQASDIYLYYDAALQQYICQLGKGEQAGVYQLECYNMMGRKMMGRTISAAEPSFLLPSAQWPKGMYLVKIQGEDQTVIQKIMLH